MGKENKSQQNREIIAIAFYCGQFLYLGNFISICENEKIHNRIKRF